MKPIEKLVERSKKCADIVHINWDKKPLTNADHIRAMTDEELAEMLYNAAGAYYSEEYWLKWLKEDYKE